MIAAAATWAWIAAAVLGVGAVIWFAVEAIKWNRLK